MPCRYLCLWHWLYFQLYFLLCVCCCYNRTFDHYIFVRPCIHSMYQSLGISVTCASVFATLFVTAFMFVFCVNGFANFWLIRQCNCVCVWCLFCLFFWKAWCSGCIISDCGCWWFLVWLFPRYLLIDSSSLFWLLRHFIACFWSTFRLLFCVTVSPTLRPAPFLVCS